MANLDVHIVVGFLGLTFIGLLAALAYARGTADRLARELTEARTLLSSAAERIADLERLGPKAHHLVEIEKLLQQLRDERAAYLKVVSTREGAPCSQPEVPGTSGPIDRSLLPSFFQ